MKKTVLIILTIIALGVGALGIWVYSIYQNGIGSYDIGGETFGAAGLASGRSDTGADTLTVTFTERLMPITINTFPFDAACSAVIAASDAAYDVVTVIAANDRQQMTFVYDVAGGKCTGRSD